MDTTLVQRFLDQIGDRGLSGAREPSEPQHAGRLVLERRPRRFVDEVALAMDVGRPAKPERDHAGAAVAWVKRSTRMKAPVRRLSVYASNATGLAVDRLQKPISLRPSVRPGLCSSVLISILCLSMVTWAGSVLVPMRSK